MKKRKIQKRGMSLDKTRIAEAVHEAVAESTLANGFGSCIEYAFAGMVAVQKATGDRCCINVGTLQVRVSDDFVVEMSPAKAREEGHPGDEIHAITVRQRKDGKMEGMDFGSRHYRAWAERFGFPWTVPAPPLYIWDADMDWFPKYGVRFVGDEALSVEVLGQIGTEIERYSAIARRALWRLYPRAYPQPPVLYISPSVVAIDLLGSG